MADRTVSARLRADVTAYIAAMRAAARATRDLGDEIQRTGRRRSDDYRRSEDGAQRLERALERLLEAERQQRAEQQRSSQETRRSSDETRRSTQETQHSSDETRRNTQETERNTQARRRNSQETRRSSDELGRFTAANRGMLRALTNSEGLLVSVGAGAAAAGAAASTAGAAFAAFGALAAPSVLRVVSAQEDLATSWSALSDQQRVSAVLANDLAEEFKELAEAYQPEALSIFNAAVGTARGLLPQLGRVAGETADDFQTLAQRITTFIDERVGGEFLAWAGQQAPRALDLLGTGMITAGDTALDLIQDIAPLGLSMLELTNGVLGAVNAVADINPMLAQFAVSAALLRAPILGAVSGIGAMTQRVRESAAANRGASLGVRALNLVTAAGPALYVAAGAGLLLLATRAGQAQTSSERLAASLRAEHRALGNNLAGYQSLMRDIAPRLNAAYAGVAQSLNQLNNHGANALRLNDANSRSLRQNAEAAFALGEEYERARIATQNINTASGQLAARYGITRAEAIRLADAAGVNLANSMDKSGQLTAAAQVKIVQYQHAVQLARSPTAQIAAALDDAGNEALQLKDRVNALTAAFDSAFGPSLAMFNATTQLREGYRQLAEQLRAAHGSMRGNSEASNQARQAFAQQLQTVRDLATATFQKTRSMEAARNAVAQQLPLLYALAGRNRDARAQVDALAQALGINTSQLNISRDAFIRQATAMLGSRTQADALWNAYQRLTGATNTGSTALTTYINRVRISAAEARNLAARTGAGTSAQQAYNARVRDALPVLYALAGRNREARAQVDALARATGNATGATNVSRSAFLRAAEAMGIARNRAERLWKELNKIKDRKAEVDVVASGRFAKLRGMDEFYPRAKGGPIPDIPGASRQYDSVPALLRVDEHVWTPEEVDAVGGHDAMYRLRAAALRGELKGFARGGRVSFARDRRPTPTVVGDVTYPIFTGITGMVTTIAKTLAEVWMRLMSGGSVVAAARSQIGVPYSWGGGGKGGPSRGIGRGAGTVGFDCSGLTEYAWWRGRRVDIGGTTYEQYPRSVPTARRPGALGFPHLGHVVIASDRPGYIIEAPYTGARVREIRSSRGYEWRWPKGASKFAEGGPVTEVDRRVGRRFLHASGGPVVLEAKELQIAGDPGGLNIRGYAAGGWVRGPAGRDKALIAATAGEYVINRRRAAEHSELVEAVNTGRVGEAMIRPAIRASTTVAAGGGATGGTGGGGGDVHVHLHNHGVIGSQIEMDNWLTSSVERLRRQGRLP